MKKQIFQGIEDKFIKVIDSLEYGEDFFVSRSRRGIFTPALTMWLMICQKLRGGEGLVSGIFEVMDGKESRIAELNTRSKRFRMRDISGNSGGYSRARARLKLSEVRDVTEAIASEFLGDSSKWKWNGKRVYLFDGTTIRIDRSSKNRKRFPATKNQHGEASTPLVLCACMHELFSGIALSPRFGAYRGSKATSEQRLYLEMLSDLPEESMLIADRNLGVFPMAYKAKEQGVEVLLRLSSARAKQFNDGESAKKNIDKVVAWQFRNSKIPGIAIPQGAVVEGRYIRHTLRRKGHRPLELYFFTTSKESARKLVSLYARRESVENDIRSLKYTLGMEMLTSKSPEMVEKEIYLGVSAYNLARAIIAYGAKKLKIKPRDISFSGALHMIRAFGVQASECLNPVEQRKFEERFIKALGQQKLSKRKRHRMEPRKIVHERQRFPRMKKSRDEEQEEIKKVLKEYGHRGYFTSVTRNS